MCVNLQNKKKLRCFLEKIVQLTKILHNRRPRQIPSLMKISPLLCVRVDYCESWIFALWPSCNGIDDDVPDIDTDVMVMMKMSMMMASMIVLIWLANNKDDIDDDDSDDDDDGAGFHLIGAAQGKLCYSSGKTTGT